MSLVNKKIPRNGKLTFSELTVGDNIYKYVVDGTCPYNISGVINKIKPVEDWLEIDYTYNGRIRSRICVYPDYYTAIDKTNNSFIIYSGSILTDEEQWKITKSTQLNFILQ